MSVKNAASKPTLGSDLKKVDAYRVKALEYQELPG